MRSEPLSAASVGLAVLDLEAVSPLLDRIVASGMTRVTTFDQLHPGVVDEATAALAVRCANALFAELLAGPSPAAWLLRPRVRPAWLSVLQALVSNASDVQQPLTVDGSPPVTVVLSLPAWQSWRADPSRVPVSLVRSRDVGATAAPRDRAQRLEIMGMLAGGIAHDFNNLLAVISSFTALVHEHMEPDHSARRDLQVVLDTTRRAADLTHQLLTFSRRQLRSSENMSLNSALGSLEPMLRRLLPANIALDFRLGNALWSVFADPTQVEQVFMNLVVNARDAMPRGGQLTVETCNVHVDEDRLLEDMEEVLTAGEYVRLTVEDTGVGMDASTRRRMFEPFFTTKGDARGTGLGLASVFGIVRGSGGFIGVHSVVGQGTRLEVYFPRSANFELPAMRTSGTYPVVGAGQTVMVVEDDELVREAARRILERAGHVVIEAPDGESALAYLARSGDIDALLTDVMLPRLNGIELADRVRQRCADLAVVYMSGHRGFGDDDQLSPGALYLSKPFTPERLLAKMREAFARRGEPPVGPQNASPTPIRR